MSSWTMVVVGICFGSMENWGGHTVHNLGAWKRVDSVEYMDDGVLRAVLGAGAGLKRRAKLVDPAGEVSCAGGKGSHARCSDP
jgi:hypothetical protein